MSSIIDGPIPEFIPTGLTGSATAFSDDSLPTNHQNKFRPYRYKTRIPGTLLADVLL
ncbi:hypothetical protein ACFS7Z_00150 [Pontibacter toksunensis]|uniref:Uncharacterized protein n=1 Tax=Pontibacter toksunensis TaxID=1332631 RepID=A0ABW6BP24_9BACT